MEKEVLKKYEKAGEIAKKMKELGRKELKEGASVLDIAEKIEKAIRKEGAEVAFPLNLSINDIAAHFTPDIDDPLVLKEGDLVKFDVGVSVDGYIGDTAFSVRIGSKTDPLIKASEKALEAFLKEISVGKTVEELSGLVEEVVTSHGFNPVRNLAGHTLDQYTQHGRLSIPNAKVASKDQLKEGDVIAMEVFVTDGEGWVAESSPTLIYMFLRPGAVRLRESRTILQMIGERFKTLPFARRWLKDVGSQLKLQMALRELVGRGIIKEYPPLRERSRGFVAQSEETVVVLEKPVVTTR